MRLAPRSLGVRLALLLLLAVVGAQAVAFTMVALESSRVGRAVARTQFLDRAATLVRLLDAVPADAVPAVLEAYGSPRRSFTLDATSFVSESAMADDAARLAHRLDRRLAAGAGQARIALVDRDTDPDAPSDHGAGKLQALRVSVRLGDGRWLNGEAPLALQTPPWIRIGLIQAVASVVAVLAVAGIAMRGIVGPVSALARAAEMAGRGAVVEPLPERGPQELRTMTAAFNGMQARSRAFVADRTRMLAAISHDLRTPIASLWLRAEMVEDADLRGAMVRTISEMGRMVDATLAFAREDALVQDSGPLDLAAMVRALVADHAVLGREVSVAAPMHLPFHGRAMTLRRALDNLVDNAVRYGDRARITLESGPDSVRILVDDDGPGMPPDRVEEMFAPFTRLEVSRNAETGGTGLGLAIVRSAVRAHGGDIRMSNRPGGGLRAEITLSTREPGPSDERPASRRAMPDVVGRGHL
ncbi:ATP-binding protein [Methylobacterium sp. J-090]|uniref:ATP-binding protein n=1 Tax=Methylobacterium sp. J-090 TaxID=2836666 RepID=UPI001FBAD74E|nr:ATP-binding protein [Methylobacterium sp. J-090]MCJ2082667.1 ATP-binding protein [Methylobacterium sp. J-090]